MKEIKAIIQPFMLSRVIDALKGMRDLPGVTVSEVKGFGRATGLNQGEPDDSIEYAAKIKLEIVVPAALADRVARTIQASAHTGNPGDGKIFVMNVDEVIKIRTGEEGEEAI